MHTKECSSAIKQKDIPPLVTAWMDLEGTVLSEVSQRKTDTIGFHLHVQSQKTKTKNTETDRKRVQMGGSQQLGVGEE